MVCFWAQSIFYFNFDQGLFEMVLKDQKYHSTWTRQKVEINSILRPQCAHYFFCFLTVCLGANAEIAKCLDLARETPKLARKSGHQLERFLLRRANQMVKDQETLNQQYCLLLAYELLYLWNALGACLKHSHAAIQIGKSL